MEKLFSFPELIFLFSVFSFFMVGTHFLMMLLFMESMSLSLYILLVFNSISIDSGTLILFLSMMVLEGAFGLTLAINSTRKTGGDFLVSS